MLGGVVVLFFIGDAPRATEQEVRDNGDVLQSKICLGQLTWLFRTSNGDKI